VSLNGSGERTKGFFRASAADILARTRVPTAASTKTHATGGNPFSLLRKGLGWAIIGSCILIALLYTGTLSDFIDGPSLVLVFAFIFFGAFNSFRIQDVLHTLKTLFSFQNIAENDALISYQVFRRLSELAVGGGVMGTTIGLVQMLQQLDDPSAIGPAMAVALSTTFYGLLASEVVFQPLAADALARGDVTRDVGQYGQEWRLMGVMGGPFLLLMVFFIMLLAMADFS